jgi:hypothetical protein
MQMVREWNLAMEHAQELTGVGWFIFDLWISNDGRSIESISIADTTIQVPMNMDRLLTLKVLLDNPFLGVNDSSSGSNPYGMEILWRKDLLQAGGGDIGPDQGGSVAVRSVVGSGNDGYLVTGEAESPGGGYDGYLLRLDGEGNILWEGQYVGDGRLPQAAVPREGGGFTLAGVLDPSGVVDRDVYVAGVDEAGDKLWEMSHDLGGQEEVGSVLAAQGDGLLVCGTVAYGPGGSDAYLLMVDGEGQVVWERVYDHGFLDRAHRVVPGRGCYFLVGETRAEDGDADMLVIRVGEDGSALWHLVYDAGGEDSARTAVRTLDGGLVVGGRTDRRDHEGPLFVKIGPEGNVVWERTYQWEGDTVREILQSLDGGFWVFGRGGSMLRVNGQWEHIWDTGWEPVGPEASVAAGGDGFYLVVGDIAGGVRAVKLKERVAEFGAACGVALSGCLLLISLAVKGGRPTLRVEVMPGK